ncbi:ROK family protein [Planctomycetota bacterium]
MKNTNNDEKCWVGFDLGGTKMLAQVFDNKFHALSRQRDRTKGHKGSESGVIRIKKLIESTLSELNIKSEELGGIGIGAPGPLDLGNGIIINAPNLGWENVPIKDELESHFKCPVVLMNDVDAGVYGEYRFGAGRGARCVLGVFPGTGVGGGCVYDGQIIRGKTGSCMEVGHMQIAPDGPLCGCGRRGCLEAVASRLAISAAAAQAAYRGDAPTLRAEAGTDLSEIRSKVLARAVAAGDTAIEQIIRNAARSIGVAVGNLVNLLLPETVILGGGLVEAMPDLFVQAVTRSAKKRVLPSYSDAFTVVPAQLGDDAAVMGAAGWVQKTVGSDGSAPSDS